MTSLYILPVVMLLWWLSWMPRYLLAVLAWSDLKVTRQSFRLAGFCCNMNAASRLDTMANAPFVISEVEVGLCALLEVWPEDAQTIFRDLLFSSYLRHLQGQNIPHAWLGLAGHILYYLLDQRVAERHE